ncbi:MAG: hypothetical protein MZV64_33220 [Ignavibacteriales bacterium]|nr:hypothetical protein [Ignavibacteriales bacterium]
MWIARQGVKRTFTDQSETAEYFDSLKLNDLHFQPVDLTKKQQKPAEMNLGELSDLIDSQKEPEQIQLLHRLNTIHVLHLQ